MSDERGNELQAPGDPTGDGDQSELVFVLGSSRRTTVAHAEEDLNALWQATTDEAAERGGSGVLRIREHNLVVYAGGESAGEQIGQVAARLAQCHPARVLVVLDEPPDGDAATELPAWITAACYRRRKGGRQVCWEQVTVPAGGVEAAQTVAAVTPLLIPDLPVVLWWPGEPAVGSELFSRLSSLADRLVIDSAGVASLGREWSALRNELRSKQRRFTMEDLSWLRLEPWRELIAEPFDDPARRDFLEEVTEVAIGFQSEDAGEERLGYVEPPSTAVGRALLLAGWLCALLGWMPEGAGWRKEGGDLILGLRRGTDRPAVRLRLKPMMAPPCAYGGVVEFKMKAPSLISAKQETGAKDEEEPGAKKEEERCLVINREGETCVCAAWFWAGHRQNLVRTLEIPMPTEDQLLCDILGRGVRDEVYERAFSIATDLAVFPGNELLSQADQN